MRKIFMAFFAAVIITAMSLVPGSVEAIPSFAKNLEKGCSECHTVYPLLNRLGKKFLEGGKKLSQEEVAPGFKVSKNFLSGRLNMRPIDKRLKKNKTTETLDKDKVLKLRSLHEAELFLAGSSGHLSYYIEIESEDEAAGSLTGFDVNLAGGYLEYHFSQHLSIISGMTNPFIYDGNNTVHHRKPIRKEWAASSKGFTPGVSQMLGVAGRFNIATYMVSFHGTEGDLEAHDPENFALRLAVDAIPQLTIGGYFDRVRKYDSAVGLATGNVISNYGLDASVEVGPCAMQLVYGIKNVENTDKNDSVVSLEMSHTIMKDDRPWISPVIQLSRYTEKAGADMTAEGALYLIYNVTEPFRISGGIEQTLSKPDRYVDKETRLIVSMDALF